MDILLALGVGATLVFALLAQLGRTNGSFVFGKIDPAVRRSMIDLVVGSSHVDPDTSRQLIKGLPPGLLSPLNVVALTFSDLSVKPADTAPKLQFDFDKPSDPDASELAGSNPETSDHRSQLRRVVNTGLNLMVVPVESSDMSSQSNAVVTSAPSAGSGIGSQTYYNSGSSPPVTGSSVRPPTMTTSIRITSTMANYPNYASTGQRVSCTPDFAHSSVNGQCVTVDQMNQRCGPNFEAAQSTKDCGAFAGNWCCYVPIRTSETSTMRPGTTMTFSVGPTASSPIPSYPIGAYYR